MPCPRSRRAKAIYIFEFEARTLPPLSVQAFSDLASSQPLPLQSFFDLHELSAPEQEPWPLHSLMPAHFTTSVVFLCDLPLAMAAPERNIDATALAMNVFFTFILLPPRGWKLLLRRSRSRARRFRR